MQNFNFNKRTYGLLIIIVAGCILFTYFYAKNEQETKGAVHQHENK